MGQPRLVIAAPHSGAGKTTVTSLICAGLRDRGLRVQPFKLGPDYLDPTHLSRAAGRETRNLDSHLLPAETLQQLFVRGAAQAEVSVLEGVMGLFDGRNPLSDEHSTADLARLLESPVVLVLDASGTARTIAPVALGLARFAPDLQVAGVILNRVGSAGHARLCELALEQVGIRCFGHVVQSAQLTLPGRHLGLLSADLHAVPERGLLEAAQALDLAGLLEVAHRAPPVQAEVATVKPLGRVRLGLARDEAFSFYYPDALDLLQELGAELVPFSPLRDGGLPDCDGLLLGGGYPEAHARELGLNQSMRDSIRGFAATGRPVVAECGGLMYLSHHLETLEGEVFEMCGVIPYHTEMTANLTLGYRDVTFLQDTPLGKAGTRVRGHKFHHSRLKHAPHQPAFQTDQGMEGYARGNVLASYVHLHYGGFPLLAAHLVQRMLGNPG